MLQKIQFLFVSNKYDLFYRWRDLLYRHNTSVDAYTENITYIYVTKPVFRIQYEYERMHLSVYSFAFHVFITCWSFLLQPANLMAGFVGSAVSVNFRIPNLSYWSVMNTFTCFRNSYFCPPVLCLSLFIFCMALLRVYNFRLVMKNELFGSVVINYLSYLRVLKQYQLNKCMLSGVIYIRQYMQVFAYVSVLSECISMQL
jgi:hypothetical protein